MGVPELKKILISSNLLKFLTIEDLEIYSKKKYIYHIDLSIIINKFIYTSDSYLNFIKRIESYFNKFINNIDNINKIIIYIDNANIIRKEALKIKRQTSKNTQIKKRTLNLQLISSNKDYLYDKNGLINKKKINNDEDYNKYFKGCVYDNFKEKKLIFNIHNKESKDTDLSSEIQEIILDNVDKDACKECFLLCSTKTDIKIIRNDIIDKLKNINSKIKNKIKLITCESRDAEIEIINKIIKKKYDDNFIICNDGDVKIFSLIYLNDKVLFSDLSPDISTNTMLLYCNKKYSRNLAIITMFFTKNDYFNGITGIAINDKLFNIINNNLKLLKLLNTDKPFIKLIKKFILLIVNEYNITLKSLTDIRKNEIKIILDNFYSYLSLDKSFYTTKAEISTINKNELYSYFT